MLFTCVLLFALRAVAYAHAVLVASEPAAGSRLPRSPAQARLVFSEPIEPALARMSLVAGDGSVAHFVTSGDPHDVHALIAPLDSLAPGTYRLLWRVVSADGHPVDGTIVFAIGAGIGGPTGAEVLADSLGPGHEPVEAGPAVFGAPLVPAILRGLALGSLMALTGLLFFISWPPATGSATGGRAFRFVSWLALALPILLAAQFAAWVVHASPEHALTSETLSAAFATSVGKVELSRGMLALLVLWAVWLARRSRAALLFALGASIVSGASGHSAAIHPVWAMPAKAMHVVAGGIWLGGLLWLLATDRRDVTAFDREAKRVSGAAFCAVLIVALSGVAQALLFLPSPLDVFRSAYGAVTLAKVTGLLVLVAFGAHHRYRILPRLASAGAIRDVFAVSLRREVVVMALVVLLGSFLAFIRPPGDLVARSSSSDRSSP